MTRERQTHAAPPPRMLMPFLPFLVEPPGKIKVHPSHMVDHAKVSTIEMPEGIKTSCSLRIIELLDAFDHLSDIL